MSILERALRMGEAKQFKAYSKRVERINGWESELQEADDEELKEQFAELRERAQAGEDPGRSAARGVRAHPRGRQAHDGRCATSTCS